MNLSKIYHYTIEKFVIPSHFQAASKFNGHPSSIKLQIFIFFHLIRLKKFLQFHSLNSCIDNLIVLRVEGGSAKLHGIRHSFSFLLSRKAFYTPIPSLSVFFKNLLINYKQFLSSSHVRASNKLNLP